MAITEVFQSSRYCPSGNCVEVASPDGHSVVVRDSKCPDTPPLQFDKEEWTAFLRGVADGQFEI